MLGDSCVTFKKLIASYKVDDISLSKNRRNRKQRLYKTFIWYRKNLVAKINSTDNFISKFKNQLQDSASWITARNIKNQPNGN